MIFVSALVAIGVPLIVIRGSNEWEDTFLNFTGMFVLIILVDAYNYDGQAQAAGASADAGVKREAFDLGRSISDTWRRVHNLYGLIGLAMVASGAFIILARSMFIDHWVLILEATEIGLFAVFWIRQTFDKQKGQPPDLDLVPAIARSVVPRAIKG